MDNSTDKESNSLDLVAFLASCLLGYFIRTLLPAGPWAAYTPVLVSYHLFLGWLLISADHEVGFSLPIVSTILTHLAFFGCVFAVVLGRRFIPFFSVFGTGIAGLAVFERSWLFSSNHKKRNERQELPVSEAIATSTADDYQEWLLYLSKQKSTTPKPGSSLKDEYEKWLLARERNRPATQSND